MTIRLALLPCLWLAALSSAARLLSQEPPQIGLAGKSYALTAEFLIKLPQAAEFSLEVREIYSDWQKRSRVEYWPASESDTDAGPAGFPAKALLYADEQQVLMFDPTKGNCRVISNAETDELFNLAMLKTEQRSPIVGPSRFLHLAAQNRAILVNSEFTKEKKLAVDNANKDMIRFDFKIPDTSVLYSLYYYINSVKNPPHGIPAELTARFVGDQAGERLLSYKFRRAELLPAEPVYGSPDGLVRRYGMESEQVVFDPLAIEPGIGCAQVSQATPADNNRLLATNFRFAFSVETGVTHMAVGYEPSISTLRVVKELATRTMETTINFFTQLTYFLVRRKANQDQLLDSVLKVRSSETHDDDATCVVFPVPSLDADLTLGQMLLGSNRLTYLGLAKVRGVEARVYEASEADWPVWFRQATAYHTRRDWISKSDKVEVRRANNPADERLLTSVVYLSRTTEDASPLDGQLLLIEITVRDAKTRIVEERREMWISDFRWHLGADSPLGAGTEQFSLGDECASASAEDNHYGRLDLLLEGEAEPEASEWLRRPVARNFALLRVVQEICAIPASLALDIDSRLERRPGRGPHGAPGPLRLAASLHVIERLRERVQLIEEGQGELKPGERRNFRFYTCAFHDCFVMAALRKHSGLFAYDSPRGGCFLYEHPVVGTFRTTIQRVFEFRPEPRELLEIYRIAHTADRQAEDELTRLVRSQSRLEHLGALELADPEHEGARLSLQLKSVAVEELDPKTPYELDEARFADTNKFVGFGLVVADSQSWRVQPARLEVAGQAGGLSEMSFGQCQTACAAAAECRSFSVCVREARLECVLSRADFRSPELVLQLLKLKLGERLLPDEERVKVERRPSCELHTKRNLDLFRQAGRQVEVKLARRRLRPVSDREQCARLCMEATMATLRADVAEARQASWEALNRPESEVEELRRLFLNFKRSHMNVCANFMYLDALRLTSVSQKQLEAFEERMKGANEDGITNGYCILDEAPAREEAPAGGAELKLRLEKFEFDFGAFFEREHGVSLAPSPLSTPERQAYQALLTDLRTQPVPPEAFGALRLSVGLGANIAYTMVASEAQCARACFLQLLQLWPGCRSFDVLELLAEGQRELHCFFNSISLHDALARERFDLVRRGADEQAHLPGMRVARLTHFEPRPGLADDSLGLANQLAADELYLDRTCAGSTHMLKLHGLGPLTALLVALAVGLVSGVLLAARLAKPQQEPDDVATLVEAQTIEFSNLVNFEGAIPELAPEKRASGQ